MLELKDILRQTFENLMSSSCPSTFRMLMQPFQLNLAPIPTVPSLQIGFHIQLCIPRWIILAARSLLHFVPILHRIWNRFISE